MTLKAKLFGFVLSAAALVIFAAPSVFAQYNAQCGGTIQWKSDTCFTIVPIYACKPGKKWDTKKIHADPFTPYKWTYGMSGPDPVCFIQFHPNPEGKTAHQYYQKVVKPSLQAKGITGLSHTDKTMNGRHVTYVTGFNNPEGSSMHMWAWRNASVGVNLQCFCVGGNCGAVTHQFEAFANSLKFISEGGCIPDK